MKVVTWDMKVVTWDMKVVTWDMKQWGTPEAGCPQLCFSWWLDGRLAHPGAHAAQRLVRMLL